MVARCSGDGSPDPLHCRYDEEDSSDGLRVYFEIKHTLPCAARQAWTLVFGEEFEALLDQEQSNIQRNIRSDLTDGDCRTRIVHVDLTDPLPPIFARALGSEGLGYTLEERMFSEDLMMRWSVTPDRLADRITAEGDYQLVDSPDGCTRIVRGQVQADIPLVGRKIEKLIASELQASYDRAATLAAHWIRENEP
jgi:hypothetical protein